MNTQYRGYGVEPGRAARLQARQKSSKLYMSASTVLKLASLIVVLALALTGLIASAARNVRADSQLNDCYRKQNAVLSHIDSVKFEIQRELLPENLGYNARTHLGMMPASGSQSVSLTIGSGGIR